ncbi:hypothetical protein I553_3684, partial [Mycobacterium xenopi 4042]
MSIDVPTGTPRTSAISDRRCGLGDYALIAEQVMAPLGPVLWPPPISVPAIAYS